MKIWPKFECSECEVISIESCFLSEQINGHPSLMASVVVNGSLEQALKLVGSRCSWKPAFGEDEAVHLFEGIVRSCDFEIEQK